MQGASLSPLRWDGGREVLGQSHDGEGGLSGKSPCPSPMAELLGPLLPCAWARPSPENRRLESRAQLSSAPPASAGENGLAFLAPATYGLLFCCPGLSHGGWGGRGRAWAKAASRRRPGLGSCWDLLMALRGGLTGRALGGHQGATMWDRA